MNVVRPTLSFITAVTCVACAGDPEPAEGVVNVAFPSTAAAVASENVSLLVFDVPKETSPASFCTTLVQQAKSGQALPPRLTESPPKPVCDFQSGATQVTVGFGDKAVLAIATRAGKPYLVGCALQNIGAGDAPVTVSLGLVSTSTSVPKTDCALLSEFCSKKCSGSL